MAIKRPFNLKKWIDENRDLLKPPINEEWIWSSDQIQRSNEAD